MSAAPGSDPGPIFLISLALSLQDRPAHSKMVFCASTKTAFSFHWPYRLTVRTPDSQSGNPGSIPGRVTKLKLRSKMAGNTNLQEVLNSLEVDCDHIQYGFTTTNAGNHTDSKEIIATFWEDEGQTIVATVDFLEESKIPYDGPFAKLSIKVHTSLELVGLTAALSTKLTEEGISANVIAAYFHDHIFVQYTNKDQAIKALLTLKDS